jgi:radical SAM superfamily enzyme YgiQ (UPF0313 family)
VANLYWEIEKRKIMKVLLYVPSGGRSLPMPSYGISVVAGALANHATVTVVDRSIDPESIDEGYEVSLTQSSDAESDAEEALKQDYELIGVQVHTGNLFLASVFLHTLRQGLSNAKLVVGGPSANIAFKLFSKARLADTFVFGDGVDAITAILLNKPKPINILSAGVITPNGHAIHLPPRGDWSTPNFHKIYGKKFELLPYLTTIGCVFNCSFCTSRRDLVGFERPTELLLDLEDFLDSQNPRMIRFNDSTFNGHLPTFRRALHTLIAAEKSPKWGAYIALASLRVIDIPLMAESGCAYVYIGIESNISEVRKNQQKIFSDATASKMIKELQRHGIMVLVSFIVDLPGSEGGSLSAIEDYMDALAPDAIHFFPYENRPDLSELVSMSEYWKALLGRTTHRTLAPQTNQSFLRWSETLRKVSHLKAKFENSGKFISESKLVRSLMLGS